MTESDNKKTAPAPDRPVMIMRFRSGQSKPERWAQTFPVICRNRACFDEVWFSTGVGILKLEEHRKRSDDMAAAAADLRKIGVIPSLQIQSTLGHADHITESAGTEGKTWGSYVGKNGEQCKYINCPRQPGFLAYWREICKIYAQWHPGSVWIDDDLRLHNHYPAMDPCGCYCEDCLALFSKEEDRIFTREELSAACDADPELARRWYGFGVRSLCGVARVIAETFREYSPETRIGFQHCDSPVRNDIFRTLLKYSGKRSASRPGGGVYSDRDPYAILDKGISCAIQKAQQPGYDVLDQVCPEIESFPRVFTGKTAQGHRLESMFYLALGMDSLSYFIIAPDYETPEWYGENLLAPLAAETPAYKDYLRISEGTEPGGVGIFGCAQGIEELGLPLIGTAFAGVSPSSSCFLVTRTCVLNSSPEELEKNLRGNIIVSGAAAEELEKRGFGGFIGNVHAELQKEVSQDTCIDHPLCRDFKGLKLNPFGEKPFRFLYEESSAVQVVTRYRNKDGADFGAGTLLYTRPDGTRAALIGCNFGTHALPSGRAVVLNRIADWVSHETLPVLTAEPRQIVLVPRIDPNGVLRGVTAVNPTIAPQSRISLLLRNVPETLERAEWIIPGSAPVFLPLLREKSFVKTELPELAAWDIGFLKLTF